MTKADLVQKIARQTGLSHSEVLNVVENLMTTIKFSLSNGENVYLRGFGTFFIKRKAEKIGRDIGKNTSLVIPAHNIPAFRPSKDFSLEEQQED